MKIKIIKGTKQIGGCITEISTDKTKIIIDYGDNLDGTNQIDIAGLTCGQKQYDAVFITHSHGDHIGNVCKILEDIPVYIEPKGIEIHNIICDFKKEYSKKIRTKNNIKKFKFNESIVIKDIKITPFIVDHSAYNSSMFLIEADNKKILHTGDYRMHGRKGILLKDTLKQIGKVDVLITEGTTLSRSEDDYLKEVDIEKELEKIINNYDQVYFINSSTNIDRLVSFYKASKKHLFIEDLCMASIASHIPNIPNPNTFKKVYTYMSEKYRNIKEPYERYRNHLSNVIEEIPFDKKFVMSIKSSMLSDLEKNKDKIKNACLIYSMWEGYIDDRRKDDNTKELIDFFENMSVPIYYKHTSGHADINTMKIVNNILNPTKVIVIHTDNKNINNNSKIFKNRIINLNDLEEIEI